MTSRTPQFDAALDDYFSKLELDAHGGQWRVCRFSGERFPVLAEDVAFYRKVRVPLPTLSPEERIRRKAAYFNNYNLFKVTSAHSGKPIVAAYDPNTPYKVFEHRAWFSDEWDPLAFGRPYDGTTPLFGQLRALQLAVPRPNLITDVTNVRSEYTNTSTNLKDSYFAFSTLAGENLYYFDCCDGSKDCVDCESVWGCTECYRCQLDYACYQCLACEDCRDCIDSRFLFDCRNCTSCFMCANLRHKKFCFMGEQLSKEEYAARMAAVNIGDYTTFARLVEQYVAMKKSAVRRPDNNFKVTNVSGDFIDNSKNCRGGFYLFNCENVHYSFGLADYRDCYDIFGGAGGELCYEYAGISTRENFDVRFSAQVNQCRDVEYCDLCYNCSNCFGCIGLRNKKFCVLNRQCTEEEYWPLVDRMKTAMLAAGEYGEFFPPESLPTPYRISFTTAYDGYLDFENATRYGYDTREIPNLTARPDGEVIATTDLPLDIRDVDDSILEKAIHDTVNDRYFKLTPYELTFYRKHGIPIPRVYPLGRLAEFRKRYTLRLRFYDRTCPTCSTQFRSVYDPKEYPTVYCESCYNTKVV
jgi:hypothetical protein